MPDFYIIGAPKCGTTALYSYLSTHPGIAMSWQKEPYHWCPDVPIRVPITDEAEYAALWRDAAPGALRGEATPAYLRSAVAAAAILRAQPRSKFIVMLRNPTAMAQAFHAQMLVSLQENIANFEEAWRMQERRQKGQRIPVSCFFPPNLQYARVCALGDQLERWMSLVPRERIHVLIQDDLRADPRATYLDVLRFLGLPDDRRTLFEPVNRNKRRRALLLVRLYRSLASIRPLGRLAHALRLTETIDRISLVEKARPPLRPAFDRELHALFLPQVEKLERLLGRDLVEWRAPTSTS